VSLTCPIPLILPLNGRSLSIDSIDDDRVCHRLLPRLDVGGLPPPRAMPSTIGVGRFAPGPRAPSGATAQLCSTLPFAFRRARSGRAFWASGETMLEAGFVGWMRAQMMNAELALLPNKHTGSSAI